MDKKSVEKLQEAGYVFLRERDIPGKSGRTNYAIMQSKEFGVWTILEKFETKAARKRKLKELSELSFILTANQL
jgi:hypothetical protein